MQWQIIINDDNAAFDDEPATEISRILRDLAERFYDASIDSSATLRDINGNSCGHVVASKMPWDK